MTTKSEPVISVLMSVYNEELYLDESIPSIINQTYKSWELIIIDDGSTDKTSEILKEYQKKDARIKVYSQENQGLTKSLNRAATLAKGTYLARQDADDLSDQKRFETQVKKLEENKQFVLVSSAINYLYADGTFITPQHTPLTLQSTIALLCRYQNPIAHGSIMMRRRIFEQLNGYDNQLIKGQDSNLLLRLLSIGNFYCFDRPLYTLRLHPGNITNTTLNSKSLFRNLWRLTYFMKTVKQYHPQFYSIPVLIRLYLRYIFYAIFFFRVNNEIIYHFQRGCQLYSEKNYTEAIKIFRRVLKAAPFFVWARLKYLGVYMKTKERMGKL